MLLKNEQFKDLRSRLLREAAAFYGDLETLLEGQTDTRSRKLLAAGYHQLGDLTDKIGESSEGPGGPEEGARGPAGAGGGVAVGSRAAARRGPHPGGRLSIARSTGDTPAELQASEELRGMATDLETESSTDDVLAGPGGELFDRRRDPGQYRENPSLAGSVAEGGGYPADGSPRPIRPTRSASLSSRRAIPTSVFRS